MSTRLDKTKDTANSISLGFEGTDSPDDIKIPSCTIEDVDRAIFDLFDKQIPLQTKENNEGVKGVPVIFATGERFAVLRRKEPLKDKQGATILPLVSIMRSSISQDPNPKMASGQNLPITIKRRISKDSQVYKRLVNQHNLRNQDGNATDAHVLPSPGSGTTPGTVATRDSKSVQTAPATRKGELLTPQFEGGIYETIVIPPVKFYSVTYDVTLWSQYTQEMNQLLMTIMSLYQDNKRRTFRLETEKGYWFVAYVESDISSGNNVDDFTDEERIIRNSFSIRVNAYVIAPDYPGAPSYIRRYVSAPSISFSISEATGEFNVDNRQLRNPSSAYPDPYLLSDLYNELTPNPIGDDPNLPLQDELTAIARVGGVDSDNTNNAIVNSVRLTDPFTGEASINKVTIKGRNQRKGETVMREEQVFDLGDLYK